MQHHVPEVGRMLPEVDVAGEADVLCRGNARIAEREDRARLLSRSEVDQPRLDARHIGPKLSLGGGLSNSHAGYGSVGRSLACVGGDAGLLYDPA